MGETCAQCRFRGGLTPVCSDSRPNKRDAYWCGDPRCTCPSQKSGSIDGQNYLASSTLPSSSDDQVTEDAPLALPSGGDQFQDQPLFGDSEQPANDDEVAQIFDSR